MPPWGVNGGGAMDDQQLGDLIAYLHSIQLSPADAKAYWAKQAAATAKNIGSVDGAGNPVINGQVLFDTNCARCHTKGYSYGEPQVPGRRRPVRSQHHQRQRAPPVPRRPGPGRLRHQRRRPRQGLRHRRHHDRLRWRHAPLRRLPQPRQEISQIVAYERSL